MRNSDFDILQRWDMGKLSINDSGTTLCVAGTMDDYAALVDRRTMKHKILDARTTGRSYG